MIFFLFSILSVISAQQSLIYNVGDQYSFNFYGQVNHGAQPVGGNSTIDSFSSMSGVMEIQMQQMDGNAFVFAMNLFNVDVETWNGASPQGKTRSRLSNNNKDNKKRQDDGGLGPDMFFTMTPAGQIVSIWYQQGDIPFFIHVKSSAINALQTRLVTPNKPQKVIQEEDLIGTHDSNFVSKSSASGLVITKNFTQSDFIQFADSAIAKSTFNVFGKSVVSVHPSGYILSTACTQSMLFVQNSVASSKHTTTKSKTSQLGYDSNIRSSGSFNLKVIPNSRNHVSRLSSHFDDLVTKKTKTSLLEIATLAVKTTSGASVKISSVSDLKEMLLASVEKTGFSELRKIVKFFEQNKEKISLYFPALIADLSEDKVLLSQSLYVLTSLNLHESNSVLRQMLQNNALRLAVLRALPASSVSDCSLLSTLISFMNNDQIIEETLLAFGAVANRCKSTSVKNTASELLFSMKSKALKSQNHARATTLSAAIFNLMGAQKPRASLVNTFIKNKKTTSDFPYNKSYEKTLTLGGEIMSVDFDFDAFIGTNFDCNQPYFNYEASATASATVDFLGNVTTAFLAEAIYGVKNGVRLANSVEVTAFGKVIYSKALPVPSFDCQVHTSQIASKSTGWSVTYAVWVSVIPVAFTADVDLDLTVDFGWSVCDTDLSAMIELVPSGQIVIAGSAMSDLLVVEGGININADFQITPTPQAYIKGSMCEVGFDITVTYDPMQASVDVWNRQETCQYWVFDCEWGPYNTDVLWSYDAGKNGPLVLVNETWKISKN